MAHFDTVIRGGTIVDGTGVPAYVSDLAIHDGRIARIGGLTSATADRTLDAAGLVVAPGFVDLHTHYDAQVHWDPWCSISSWHGVTSVVLGNCGFGFAPVREADRDRAMLAMTRNEAIPIESMRQGMKWTWQTFPEWLDALAAMPKGVNCLHYAPLAPLMTWVIGSAEEAKRRSPTRAELDEMKALLHAAMDAGACGFSYQRLGENSVQGDYDGSPMVTDVMGDDVVLAFASVLRERDEGMIQTTEASGREFYEALARASGRPILQNICFAQDANPETHRDQMRWLEDVNDRGLRIFGQGFTLRSPAVFQLLEWSLWDSTETWRDAMNGSLEKRLGVMRDPAARARMCAESDSGALITPTISGPLEHLVVSDVAGRDELAALVGRPLAEIAAERDQHVVETLLDLAIATELALEVSADTNPCAPQLMAELLSSPYVIPGVSDGGAHTKFITNGSWPTDLLEWLVRDHELLTLEQAHHKLSRLPAHAAGFRDRGTLIEDAPADVVVYDPKRIRRLPDWRGSEIRHDLPGGEWRRVQHADGYHWTIVNGVITFEGQDCTGAVSGRLLRHGRG